MLTQDSWSLGLQVAQNHLESVFYSHQAASLLGKPSVSFPSLCP